MSVLIKRIEMPTNCYNCPFDFGGGCYFGTIEDEYMCPDHGRAEWCPLVPVPPHGRLVDADAIMSTIDVGDDFMFVWAITDAPTIIPAEEAAKKDGGQDE